MCVWLISIKKYKHLKCVLKENINIDTISFVSKLYAIFLLKNNNLILICIYEVIYLGYRGGE